MIIITCSGYLETGDKIVILDDLEEKKEREDKTEREEREMGDPSFYCGDPDAGCSEEDLRGQLED